MLTTRKIEGEWHVNGLPLIVTKAQFAPRWGCPQEWLVCDARAPDRVLAGGYHSKTSALEALTTIALMCGHGNASQAA